MAVPDAARPSLARRLIDDAQTADQYRATFGRIHPRLGDGSVFSRCLLTRPPPEPDADNAQYLGAITTAAVSLWQKLMERRA